MKPVLHFPRFGKTLLAAALVAMAGIAGLPAEAKPKQASAAAGKPIKGEINASKALTFLYGNAAANSADDAKMGRTHHAKIRKMQRLPDWENFAGKSARADIVHEARYTEQGKEKYLIITGITLPSGENDCFACAPLAQGALFAKEGGQWVLEAQSKDLKAGGTYGEVQGGFTQIEVGRGKYGFLHSGGGMKRDCFWDGYGIVMPYNGALGTFGLGGLEYCDMSGLIGGEEDPEFTKCKGRKQKPVGKKESVDGGVVIGEILTREPEEEYSFRGTWNGKLMTVDTGAEYYDFVMQFKQREEACEPITWKTQRFHFENGRYKEAGAK